MVEENSRSVPTLTSPAVSRVSQNHLFVRQRSRRSSARLFRIAHETGAVRFRTPGTLRRRARLPLVASRLCRASGRVQGRDRRLPPRRRPDRRRRTIARFRDAVEMELGGSAQPAARGDGRRFPANIRAARDAMPDRPARRVWRHATWPQPVRCETSIRGAIGARSCRPDEIGERVSLRRMAR